MITEPAKGCLTMPNFTCPHGQLPLLSSLSEETENKRWIMTESNQLTLLVCLRKQEIKGGL